MNRDDLMKQDKIAIIEILLATSAIVDQQSEKIAEQAKIIAEQSTKIADLEARLNQNSTNSSQPPSRDLFPKPRSLRKPSGKKAGGQSGHKGKGLKLPQPPDVIVQHHPVECVDCDHADECMEPKQVSDRRYEVDIEIKTITTEHQRLCVQCPRTNEMVTGNFPIGITSTVQYGVNLEALAVCLNTIGMVSLNRTHELLSGIFGVPLSVGTIATMVKKCADAVRKTVSDVKDALLREPLIHFDETGIRVDKITYWAHIACTENLKYIFITEKRGKKGMDAAGILPNYVGTGIHDCWGPYFKYILIRHGLCCAHLLRELIAVLENFHQKWAQKLIDLLLEMKKTKEELILDGQYQAPEQVWQKYSQKYDEILEEALAQNPLPEKDPNKKGRPKRGKVRALIDRLVLRKEQWLLFFTDFSVPFTNNQAERDFRLVKVKQKVSGGFRTEEGAKDFAAITSFVGTARKRGISPFCAVKDALLNQPFSIGCITISGVENFELCHSKNMVLPTVS